MSACWRESKFGRTEKQMTFPKLPTSTFHPHLRALMHRYHNRDLFRGSCFSRLAAAAAGSLRKVDMNGRPPSPLPLDWLGPAPHVWQALAPHCGRWLRGRLAGRCRMPLVSRNLSASLPQSQTTPHFWSLFFPPCLSSQLILGCSRDLWTECDINSHWSSSLRP